MLPKPKGKGAHGLLQNIYGLRTYIGGVSAIASSACRRLEPKYITNPLAIIATIPAASNQSKCSLKKKYPKATP